VNNAMVVAIYYIHALSILVVLFALYVTFVLTGMGVVLYINGTIMLAIYTYEALATGLSCIVTGL
jgi:hypothetical protein